MSQTTSYEMTLLKPGFHADQTKPKEKLDPQKSEETKNPEKNLTTEKTQTKFNFFSTVSNHEELKEGLMDEKIEPSRNTRTIITSKDEVEKLLGKRPVKELNRLDSETNIACQQCLIH